MSRLTFLFALLIASVTSFETTDAQGPFNPFEELDFWSEAELPLPVYYWDNGNAGLDAETGMTLDSGGALNAAITTWNDASINSLGFLYGGTSTVYQENAVNVSFGEHEVFDIFDAIGIALIEYNVDFDNPHIPRCEWKATGADVLINKDYSYTTSEAGSSSGAFGLQSLFTHELGHVLGLPHVENQTAVMSSVYNGLTELQPIDLLMLENEKVFEHATCGLPLSSAGKLEWYLAADSGSGFSNIEDALVQELLTGDIPQTTIPGLFQPEAKAEVLLSFDELASRDDLVISLTEGYLADGSKEIEFGVSIDDLVWEDGLRRELLNLDANGQIELEVEFLRLETAGPIDFEDVVDSALLTATVSFDGSRLEIEPLRYEFDDALFFDFATFNSNGLKGIEISGISFGIQSVPEPGALSLLAFAGIGAVTYRRKRLDKLEEWV